MLFGGSFGRLPFANRAEIALRFSPNEACKRVADFCRHLDIGSVGAGINDVYQLGRRLDSRHDVTPW